MQVPERSNPRSRGSLAGVGAEAKDNAVQRARRALGASEVPRPDHRGAPDAPCPSPGVRGGVAGGTTGRWASGHEHSPQVPHHHVPPGCHTVPRVHLHPAQCGEQPPGSRGPETEPPPRAPGPPSSPARGPCGRRAAPGLQRPATSPPHLCRRSRFPTLVASCARFSFLLYFIPVCMCVRARRDELK